jgi:PrtD family type I secretion system ABC transporter
MPAAAMAGTGGAATAPSATMARQVLRRCAPHIAFSALFALLVDVLYLASPIYLINVYDRVLSSGNRYTLVMLSAALALATLALVLLDNTRGKVLMRMGIRLDHDLARPLMRTLVRRGSLPGGSRSAQSLRDLDNFRQVVTGPAILILFNAPWTPLFSAVLYLLHPVLALEAVLGAAALLALAVANELAIRRPMAAAADAARTNYAAADELVRNAEAVMSMGMEAPLVERWTASRTDFLALQLTASARAAGFAGAIKLTRYLLQALIVATAVWLILDQVVAPGVLFPAMILLGRALAPVEQAAQSWKSILGARHAFATIASLLSEPMVPSSSVALDRIEGGIAAERITLALPGRDKPILRGVGFQIAGGQVLGIVGANGSGKSSLARVMAGIWPASAGSIRLDGADLAQLCREDVRRAIGYLPQDVQLLSGTVAENIARFTDADGADVVAAARRARVHEQILRLPEGYDTDVGDGGMRLSGGVRQRIGLARAVFGDPPVVILDEPNANLDADSEAGLVALMSELRDRGRTVVIIAHRPHLMATADFLLLLNEGTVELFGPRAEILPRITRPQPVRITAAGMEAGR